MQRICAYDAPGPTCIHAASRSMHPSQPRCRAASAARDMDARHSVACTCMISSTEGSRSANSGRTGHCGEGEGDDGRNQEVAT